MDKNRKTDKSRKTDNSPKLEKSPLTDKSPKLEKSPRTDKSPKLTQSPRNTANECKLVEEITRTRGFLQKFASKAENVNIARKNSPYHRAAAGNKHQTDYIEQLRQKYAAMKADPERNIVVQKYKLSKKFVLGTKNEPRIVELIKGLYSPDETNHVDFANKNIGGGYLTYGMAQEEVICCERADFGFFIAEMYARKTPITIDDDEALIILGADFCCGIDFYGRVPDDWDEKCCFFKSPYVMETALIAIDCIRPKWKKYSRAHIEWCVKKAYCGFQAAPGESVTTGQWGCGAFFNNKHVMYCVQALAAWMAGKKLYYHAPYAQVMKGYEMVKKWGKQKIPFEACLDELVKTCDSDPAWETAWDPTQATDEFGEVVLEGNLAAKDAGPKDEDRVRVMPVKDFMAYATEKWPDFGKGSPRRRKEALPPPPAPKYAA